MSAAHTVTDIQCPWRESGNIPGETVMGIRVCDNHFLDRRTKHKIEFRRCRSVENGNDNAAPIGEIDERTELVHSRFYGVDLHAILCPRFPFL